MSAGIAAWPNLKPPLSSLSTTSYTRRLDRSSIAGARVGGGGLLVDLRHALIDFADPPFVRLRPLLGLLEALRQRVDLVVHLADALTHHLLGGAGARAAHGQRRYRNCRHEPLHLQLL